jgi:predicted membrane protein
MSGAGSATGNTRSQACQDLRDSYRLGIGDLRVDLSDVKLPVGETHVNGRVDVGRLEFIVPPDVALKVHGDAQFGGVTSSAEPRMGTTSTTA